MITVYGAPKCQGCKATTKWLDKRGVAYEYVDVENDTVTTNNLLEMGYSSLPVVVAETDKHWCGFRPDMLESLV